MNISISALEVDLILSISGNTKDKFVLQSMFVSQQKSIHPSLKLETLEAAMVMASRLIKEQIEKTPTKDLGPKSPQIEK